MKLENDSDTGKESKKKFSQTSNLPPCHLFYCSCKQLLSCPKFDTCFTIFFSIFTINDTLYSILLSIDARDATNFITYILKIGMSPITKKNFKHLFIIYCLSNTNHIFTTSVCKFFVVDFVV